MSDDVRAAVLAERKAACDLAEIWAARFDRLSDAGGNETIDAMCARQLRRYFTAFATELNAEMHLPDVPAPADAETGMAHG